MPYDSGGQASVTRQIAVTGQTVQAAQVNVPFDDIQSMLSQVLLRSGIAPMTGNLNMNGFKFSNLPEGTNPADAVIKSQLDSAIATLNGAVDHIISVKSSDYTATDANFNLVFQFTASATLTLPLASTSRAYWFCTVVASGGDVKILPNVADTVDSKSSSVGITLKAGQTASIFRTGTTTYSSVIYSNAYKGASAIGRRGLDLSRVGQFSISVSAGSIGSDETIPSLLVLPAAMTKSLAATWAVGTGNGGLDTGTVGNGTYYAFLIRREDTGVVDVLFSLSPNTPVLPASYTLKSPLGSFYRSGGYTMPFGSEPLGLWTDEFGELNLPLGVTITVQDASPTARGSIVPVYLKSGNSAAYTANVALSLGTLLGTWKNTGAINTTICTAQKVSY